jgi:hypothetical protein
VGIELGHISTSITEHRSKKGIWVVRRLADKKGMWVVRRLAGSRRISRIEKD